MEQDNYVFPGQRFAQNGYCTGHGQGMTLRDWFAGQAINAAIHKIVSDDDLLSGDNISYWAYRYADAMIEARKK